VFNLKRLGSFDVVSFCLVMLANVPSGNCKSTETESKICKYSVMLITGYNLNDLWSGDVWITKKVNH